MKFGLRNFNSKKRISSRLTSKGTRSIKKMFIPGYGTKGIGWITNPKKASYNHIYNKTTVSIDELEKNESKVRNMNTSNKNENIIAIIIIGLIILLPCITYVINSYDRLKQAKLEGELIESGNFTSASNIIEENKYIKYFLGETESRGFVEYETTKKFVEMMKWCSKEDIYVELFSDELKERITLEQFKEYKIDGFTIEDTTSMLLADESVYISFITYNRYR